MAQVGIVLVSHSSKIAEGIQDIIQQVMPETPLGLAGGTDEGEIGTSIEKIQSAIDAADQGKGVLLFFDLGSAKMNAEMAIEFSERDDLLIAEAPLLEGAYIGAVESGMNKTLEEVKKAAEKHYHTE